MRFRHPYMRKLPHSSPSGTRFDSFAYVEQFNELRVLHIAQYVEDVNKTCFAMLNPRRSGHPRRERSKTEIFGSSPHASGCSIFRRAPFTLGQYLTRGMARTLWISRT